MLRGFQSFSIKYVKMSQCWSIKNSESSLLRVIISNKMLLRTKKDDSNFSALFKPVPIKTSSDDINIGAELAGNLDKAEVLKVLNKFSQKKEVKLLCSENGLDSELLISTTKLKLQ